MTTSVAMLLIGGLLLLVAIIGGGLELKELKIPKVDRLPRLGCGVAGIFFVLLGVGFSEAGQGAAHADAPPMALAARIEPARARMTVVNKLTPEGVRNGHAEQASIRIDGNYAGQITTTSEFPTAELVIEVAEGMHSFALEGKALQSINNQPMEIRCFGTGMIEVVDGARFSFEGRFDEGGGPCLLWLEKL